MPLIQARRTEIAGEATANTLTAKHTRR